MHYRHVCSGMSLCPEGTVLGSSSYFYRRAASESLLGLAWRCHLWGKKLPRKTPGSLCWEEAEMSASMPAGSQKSVATRSSHRALLQKLQYDASPAYFFCSYLTIDRLQRVPVRRPPSMGEQRSTNSWLKSRKSPAESLERSLTRPLSRAKLQSKLSRLSLRRNRSISVRLMTGKL